MFFFLPVTQLFADCYTNCYAAAGRALGIDVLTVSEGHISLPPYNFGFIGGSCGERGGKVYFCGSINSHPDGARIKEFCEKHGKTAISLSDRELIDVGSLFLYNVKIKTRELSKSSLIF